MSLISHHRPKSIWSDKAFNWLFHCAFFEFFEAPREFLLKSASAERRKLGPFADLVGGPAAAQAPPRLRIETANVDARR